MGFLSFLKNNENTRKVFGKRELKIIEKQMLGVALTQSEKNRLSRDIRKKLEFIQQASRYHDEFKLKRGSEIKKNIQGAKEVILEDKLAKEIQKIMLFGSAVDNTLTFRSDIDLAVQFKDITTKEATLFRARISGSVDQKIDIQVFNTLPKKIRKEIVKKHKVLYENTR
jgi:predicted nucleotidyltransferase